MPIRAFLFDFDGLLLDTETASRAGWQWLYREHGQELPLDKWALMVGTVQGWDPWGHLEELAGRPLDRPSLNERRYAHELSLLETEELRPGILDYLDAARRHGLKRAIVSSASRPWIDMHLERLESAVGWDAIVTADHDPERAKPRPTLYLEALDALGVEPDEAIAFEDSPNGAKAAKAAGVYVVGIPNDVTRELGLADAADTVVESLAELPPDELLARFRMTEFPWVTREHVRFRDVDAMGHVNNAVYSTYLEQARIAILGGLEPFILARVEIDFEAELREGAEIEVRSRCSRIGAKSFTLEHEIWAGERRVAVAQSVLVGYDYTVGASVSLTENQKRRLTA